MQTTIHAVLTGRVQPFGPKGEPSAFRKQPVDAAIALTKTGLQGDEQADPRYHGGPDKALLHYSYDHYPAWQQERPELAEHFAAPGAFGENISSHDLTEATVCIGDQFRLGTATVEISQGRQPCWKLGHRFGAADMVRQVIDSRRSGWYYRIINTGEVRAGDSIALLARPYPEWPVARVLGLLVGNDRDRTAITALKALAVLSTSWRERARRLEGNLNRRT